MSEGIINNFIVNKETNAVMINKYYNNKEHRSSLKPFLDDMVKALDESTAETNSKEEIKRQLSYIIREIDPLY
jgi:hypothetical protein